MSNDPLVAQLLQAASKAQPSVPVSAGGVPPGPVQQPPVPPHNFQNGASNDVQELLNKVVLRDTVGNSSTGATPPQPAVNQNTSEPVIPNPFEEPKTDEPKTDEPKTDVTDEPDKKSIVDGTDEPTDEEIAKELGLTGNDGHFKKLRKLAYFAKKSAAEKETEIVKLTEKLERIEKGEIKTKAIEERDQQIEDLTYFQKLHNLKGSEEYTDKFVKPLDATRQKLVNLAADYKVSADVLNEAVNTQNSADLNRLLSRHFDELGAIEVKQLVREAQKIEKDMLVAEQEPENVLNRLTEESKIANQQKDIERRKVIIVQAQSSWEHAVKAIQQEGLVQELIYRASDTMHNEQVVKPILQKAAKDFGKLVKDLAEGGLRELSEEKGFALAKMLLLANTSAIAVASREQALKEAGSLKSTLDTRSRMNRPAIGGSRGGSSGGSERVPTSPRDAAESLISKVLSGS